MNHKNKKISPSQRTLGGKWEDAEMLIQHVVTYAETLYV